MSDEQKTKKVIERIELCAELVDQAEAWLEQVASECPEVSLSRKELLNHLLLEHGSKLNEAELLKIREKFFNTVKYLKSLLKKAEAAKASGEELTIPTRLQPVKKRKKRSNDTSSEANADSLELQIPEIEQTNPVP